jgi:hypothetical protein
MNQSKLQISLSPALRRLLPAFDLQILLIDAMIHSIRMIHSMIRHSQSLQSHHHGKARPAF